MLTMLGMGLDLTFDQLGRGLAERPGATLVGLLVNILVFPLLALGIAWGFGLSGPLFAGFLLCAASPGGGTGSLLTWMSRGRIAFSIGLLVLLTLSSLVVTPMWMLAFAPPTTGADPWDAAALMLRPIILYILLPLAAGLYTRRVAPELALRWQPRVARVSVWLLVAIVLAYVVLKGPLLFDAGGGILGASGLAVLLSLVSGMLLRPQGQGGWRRALGFTTGVRNMTLGLLLASTCYREDETLLAVLAYGMFMYLIGVPSAAWFGRRARAEDPERQLA